MRPQTCLFPLQTNFLKYCDDDADDELFWVYFLFLLFIFTPTSFLTYLHIPPPFRFVVLHFPFFLSVLANGMMLNLP